MIASGSQGHRGDGVKRAQIRRGNRCGFSDVRASSQTGWILQDMYGVKFEQPSENNGIQEAPAPAADITGKRIICTPYRYSNSGIIKR